MELHDDYIAREINLKDLLFRLLYKWRKVLVISIIFMILLGGYKYFSGMRSVNDIATIQNQEKVYQTNFKIYESSKEALEKEIENITVSLERQKEYNGKSVLMQMNPFNEYRANKSFFVSTDYKIMPNLIYQDIDITKSVIQSYLSAAQNGDMFKYIIDNLSYDIEPKYLKELVYVNGDNYTNMLNVKVVQSDNEKCKEIFTLVIEYFNHIKYNISKAVGEHTLTGIDESIQITVDLDVDNIQKNNILAITNYEISLTEKQNALKALVVPAKTVISDTIVIKSAIKYAVAGFVLGAFLVSTILLISYIASDKLLNAKNIRTCYNIRVLGIIKKDKKKRIFEFIDRLIYRLEGNPENQVIENESIKRIAANLKAIFELNNINNGDIVFTGTIKPNDIKSVSDKVNKELKDSSYQLLSDANISYTASTIDQIMRCNAVVIVEEIGSSTYSEITKQLEYIHDLGKKVLGVILV